MMRALAVARKGLRWWGAGCGTLGGRRQRGRLGLQRHTAQRLDAGEEPVGQRGAQRASRAGGVAKEAVGLPHVRLCIHLTQPAGSVRSLDGARPRPCLERAPAPRARPAPRG